MYQLTRVGFTVGASLETFILLSNTDETPMDMGTEPGQHYDPHKSECRPVAKLAELPLNPQ